MTDLMNEVTAPAVDQGGPLGDTPPLPPQPTPTLDDATKALLLRYGFDHVPTVDELRARKAARQAEVREEVLFQADRRSWCDDGTRQVCANLRIQRPGPRTTRHVTAKITVDMDFETVTWTEQGALAVALNHRRLPTGDHWNGTRVSNVVIEGLAVDGNPYELTDDLRKELTYDTE